MPILSHNHLPRVTIALLVAGISLASCSSLQISDPGHIAADDWLTEGGSATRTNSVESRLKLPLEEEWVYNAGGGFGPGGALVAGSYVYAHTRKGELHAIGLENGKKKGVESFGESVNGTPAMRGTVIFVPSAWGSRHGVVAHDLSSGREVWKIDCPPVDEGVLLFDNMVIFSDVESRLHAVDARIGEAIWQRPFDSARAITTTPILVDDATLILADDKGGVHAVSPRTGDLLWTREIGEAIYATPASTAGSVIIGSARGSLYALAVANGEIQWRQNLTDSSVKMASPAIAGKRVVIGASDGMVRAFSLTDGTLEWTWHGDGAITAAPVIAGDQVFFGTMRKSVHGLDLASGHELWTAEVEGRVKSAPSIRGGSLFILSEPRHVYKFSSKEQDSVASSG